LCVFVCLYGAFKSISVILKHLNIIDGGRPQCKGSIKHPGRTMHQPTECQLELVINIHVYTSLLLTMNWKHANGI